MRSGAMSLGAVWGEADSDPWIQDNQDPDLYPGLPAYLLPPIGLASFSRTCFSDPGVVTSLTSSFLPVNGNEGDMDEGVSYDGIRTSFWCPCVPSLISFAAVMDNCTQTWTY